MEQVYTWDSGIEDMWLHVEFFHTIARALTMNGHELLNAHVEVGTMF